MSSPTLPESELVTFREALGDAAQPLALAHFERRPGLWVALSGARTPDYNLALVHGGDVATNVHRAVEALHDNNENPGLIMLAGAGRSAVDDLSARGWRHVRTMPFMRQKPRVVELDPAVEIVTAETLAEARECLAAAFKLPVEALQGVLNEELISDPRVEALALRDEEGIAGVTIGTWGYRGASAWSLGVHPRARRSRVGLRLVTRGLAKLNELPVRVPLVFLATPEGRIVNEHMGAEWLEDWEIWSRPRWLMPGA